MKNQIKTYYIPKNPNITKGTIYTLYLNNITNLDLSSIKEDYNITLNNIITPFKENKIIIEETDYNKLMKITNQIQELITKTTNDIKKYVEIENNNLTELNKLNTEYQKILKTFQKEREI